jgi:hypothetical protein
MSDNLRRMPLAAEVNPFEAEVGGHQHFVCARDPQHGAIVANADANAGGFPGSIPNSADEFLFR